MKIYLTSLLLLLLLHSKSYSQEIELVRNSEHIISYKCLNDNIVFKLDLIGDTTNNLNGTWPQIDYFQIWVDYNQNKKVDRLIDRMFSPYYKKVCKSYLHTKSRSTTCYFDSNSVLKRNFTKTNNLPIAHVSFEIIIPKKELSSLEGASVYFKIYNENRVSFIYPEDAYQFKNLFKIRCEPI